MGGYLFMRNQINRLAAGLNEPARFAETRRHFEAVNAALNRSHVNGQQDALCVFEAMAMMLGQLTGALSQRERDEFLGYVVVRANEHAKVFRAASKAAAHLFDG
jgi:hypothetical protein